jgi:4-hydroxy-tetrahydrodipicolinate synthase
MSTFSLRGTYTALVTPFDSDGSQIDWAAYEKLVAGQIEGGVSGLVPCGTTGETPTLTDAEQREVVQRTAALVRGKLPILAGTGTNNTKKSIDLSKAALEAGADAVMVVMPYYNKPSQEGMIRHVEVIAREVSAPIVLYNIPGRSGVELGVESFLRILERCPNVVGIKDATGNVLHCQELLRRAGERVSVVSGDDPLTLPLMSVGAKGVISVTSNLYPQEVSASVEDALLGRWEESPAQTPAPVAGAPRAFSRAESAGGQGCARAEEAHATERAAADGRGQRSHAPGADRSDACVRGAVRLAVHGATGRMGQNVLKLARAQGDIQIVGGACASNDPAEGRDIGELAGIGPVGVVATADVGSALLGADVVIDFSTASAVPNLLALAARNKVAVGQRNHQSRRGWKARPRSRGGERARIVGREHEPRHSGTGRARGARTAQAGTRLRRRDRGDPPPQEGGRTERDRQAPRGCRASGTRRPQRVARTRR